MAFPIQRLRRLRQHETFRRMVRETRLSASDLIYPMFVMEGKDQRREIASMPGQFRVSTDLLVKEAGEVAGLGIPAVMLFGIPDRKDDRGTSAVDPNGIVQRAIKAVKDHVPGLIVVTDVCIDEYTSHGHCGIVKDGRILNDETLECLRAMARTHAQAGADMVAPSDMMDGRVASDRSWIMRDTRNYRSWRTRQNSLPVSTLPSAMRPAPRRSSATGSPIKWTPPTGAKRCERSHLMWKKELISSW
jgi:porphobilinogen synthase